MITILMATYNGGQYIGEQLDSLLTQTISNINIVVRDDGSTDDTWHILNDYYSRARDKITLIKSDINSGGAKHNFLRLMVDFKDDYIMLCDQDDVWLPDKVEKTLAEMKRLEELHGVDCPLLVHTDLHVVDNGLKTISPSFKAAMNADYTKTSLNEQLIQNTLTGCTCMYNRALAKTIRRVPDGYVVMHDWYLMLIASAFGVISHVNEATILYRQHEANAVGAKDVRTLGYKLNRILNLGEVREAVNISYKQAETFFNEFYNLLTPEQVALVRAYIKIPSLAKFARWRTARRLGVMKSGLSRRIAHFIVI